MLSEPLTHRPPGYCQMFQMCTITCYQIMRVMTRLYTCPAPLSRASRHFFCSARWLNQMLPYIYGGRSTSRRHPPHASHAGAGWLAVARPEAAAFLTRSWLAGCSEDRATPPNHPQRPPPQIEPPGGPKTAHSPRSRRPPPRANPIPPASKVHVCAVPSPRSAVADRGEAHGLGWVKPTPFSADFVPVLGVAKLVFYGNFS